MDSDRNDNVCELYETELKSRKIDGSTNLRILFECPVCHEVANQPIFVCSGCHTICGDCRPSVNQCPKCNSPVSKKKCAFAEKVMGQLSMKCKFEDDGCRVYVAAIEYRRHILKCPVRPIDCFMTKCGQSIPFKKFFTHLTTFHGDKVNGVDNNNSHNIEWWIEGDPTKTARWPPYYLTCYDNVFLCMAISTVHGSWEWAWIIASEEEAKRFQLRAEIGNEEKMINLQWTGAVHSIRKSIQEIVASGIVFVTNTKELQNPYLFHKTGQNRHYWHTDVEIIQIAPPPPGFVPYIRTDDAGMVSFEGNRFKTGVSPASNNVQKSTKNAEVIEVDYSVPRNPPKTINFPDDTDRVGSVTAITNKFNPFRENTNNADKDDGVNMTTELISMNGGKAGGRTMDKQSGTDIPINKPIGSKSTPDVSTDKSSRNKSVQFDSKSMPELSINGKSVTISNKDMEVTMTVSFDNDEEDLSANQVNALKMNEIKGNDLNRSKGQENDSSRAGGRDNDWNSSNNPDNGLPQGNSYKGNNAMGMGRKSNPGYTGNTDDEEIVTGSTSRNRSSANVPPENSNFNSNNINNSQNPQNTQLTASGQLNTNNSQNAQNAQLTSSGQPIVLIQLGVAPMQVVDREALLEILSQSQARPTSSASVPKGEPPYYLHENTK